MQLAQHFCRIGLPAALLVVGCVAQCLAQTSGNPQRPPSNSDIPSIGGPDDPTPVESPAQRTARLAQLQDAMFPKGLDDVEPFNHWHKHTAPAPETVARIHVLASGGTVQRQGYGFVARCDGFVLVPASLFPPDAPSPDKILIGFASADGEELKEELPAVGLPRFHSTRAPYVFLKVNGHHLPCLPMLDARNVCPDVTVKLLWAKSADMPTADVKAMTLNGSIEDVSKDADTFTVRIAGENESGNVPQPGTVVSTADGIASLGIVTSVVKGEKGTVLTCASYANLHWVSNDIGLKISPSDINGSGGSGNMIKVPGGPVRIGGGVGTNYFDWYGIDYGCCPDFLIDRDPVTVGEYRSWLDPNKAPRMPEGWLQTDELHKHYRKDDLPVTSPWVQDAMLYAAEHGKRLVTPVEWARATIGPNLEWLARYMEDFNEAQGKLDALDAQKYGEYVAYVSAITVNGRPMTVSQAADRVWCDTPSMRRLNEEERKIYRKWFAKYWFPLQSSPVGMYPEDTGKYGVHNILMNMPELLLPNFARRTNEPAWKPLSASVEPYFSFVRNECLFADITQDDLDGVFITFFPPKGARPRIKTIEGKGSTLATYTYETSPRATFRCAK